MDRIKLKDKVAKMVDGLIGEVLEERKSEKAIHKWLLIRLDRIKESTEQSINYIQDSVDEMQQIL